MKKVSDLNQNRREFINYSAKCLISMIYLNACSQETTGELHTDELTTDELTTDELATDTFIRDQIKYADLLPLLANRFPRSMIQSIDLSSMDLSLDLLLVSGTYPTDIEGLIYFIHPLRTKDQSPILLGDGMLNVLRFGSEGLRIERNLLKPPCYYLEQLCQGSDRGFEAHDLLKSSKVYGKREILNTNLIRFQDHLICANDAGRPYLIDQKSLKLKTPIGRYDQWKTTISDDDVNLFNAQPLKGYMTTAHPAYDHDECFFVNWCMHMPHLGVNGFIELLKWQGDEKLSRYLLKIKDEMGNLQPVHIEMSVHQIALTSHYVVILDTAFRTEIEDVVGISKTAVTPQRDESILYLVPRSKMLEMNDLYSIEIEVQKIVIPRESSHFFVDPKHLENGHFLLYLAHQCASDPSEFITDEDIHPISKQKHDPSLYGMLASTTDIGVFGKYEINPTEAIVVSSQILIDPKLYGGPSLYTMPNFSINESPSQVWLLSFGLWDELRSQRIEDAYTDYAYRQVAISNLKDQPASLIRVQLSTFKITDAFSFPAGRFPSTPTFVPRKNQQNANDGYLIVIVFADHESAISSGHEIWGFDAQNLEKGPIFRLSHPSLKMNFSLHSQYIRQISQMDQAPQTTQTHQYNEIDLYQDYESRLSKLSPEEKALFENAITMFYDELAK
jgi:carotenoid cleavage dioxygenase-like enzyme